MPNNKQLSRRASNPHARLILIRGMPGSQKSEIAIQHYIKKGYKHIEAEMYFTDATTGVYTFNALEQKDAHAWAMAAMGAELDLGSKVVISNQFVRVRDIQEYIYSSNLCDSEIVVHHAFGNSETGTKMPEWKLEKARWNWQPYAKETFAKLLPCGQLQVTGTMPVTEPPMTSKEPICV